MKKIILSAILLFAGFAQAQDPIVLVEGNGVEITNGYEYVSHELSLQGDAKLYLLVSNLTSEDIYVKLRMDSMVNADGNSEFIEFCFGDQCYIEAGQNTTVPANINSALIPAGSHNINTDHFANAYAGDVPGEDVVYNMSFVQYASDNTEIGTLVSFTYRYSPTAGVNDLAGLQNIGIGIKSTVVNNLLEIDAAHNATLNVFNMNGQLVKAATIKNGANAVDLSGQAAGVYIAKFTTEENKTSQVRIVKN